MFIETEAFISVPMHGHPKKYMLVDIGTEGAAMVKEIEDAEQARRKMPILTNLRDTRLFAKVPYRYNKCDFKVEGLTPVQALVKGDRIECRLEFCGVWNMEFFWKFNYIKTP